MNECDFCGEEFDSAPNTELSRLDLCVCNMCGEIAKEQLELSGEIEDDEDSDWCDIDEGPGLNY